MNNRRRYLAPWRRTTMAAEAVAVGAAGRELLAALEGKSAIYHCISRVVDHTFRLGPDEKEAFVQVLRAYEAFSRVRVLTFCVMSNHFHVLVEVPERPEKDPDDRELLSWLGVLYSAQQVAEVRRELELHRSHGNHAAAEALRQRFLRRMWDLSCFMQGVKQRFTRWFNRRHRRTGCLWDERFKSVLVEDGHAARVVAAYIDLNPVRAGIVRRPEAYRWSGWGEAAVGKVRAREGLRQVMLERELARSGAEVAVAAVAEWKEVEAEYGRLMAEDLGKKKGRAETGSIGGRRSGEGRRGAMAETELVRRRVRWFVDGLVVGSRGFVDGVFELTRWRFSAGRTSGARRMPKADTTLRSMRALRVRVYGPAPGGAA